MKYVFEGKRVEWWTFKGSDIYYTTDEEGRGVFRVRNGERSQLLGTLQFSLAGLTKSSARAKIRKFMRPDF